MKSCGSNGAVCWWSGPRVVQESKTLVLNNLELTPLVFARVTDVRRNGVGKDRADEGFINTKFVVL